MAYTVQVTPQAQADIRLIHQFIRTESPQAAHAWLDGINRAIADMTMFPRRHPRIPESMFAPREPRHALLWNYRVIFEIEGEVCTILTIRHAARRPVSGHDL